MSRHLWIESTKFLFSSRKEICVWNEYRFWVIRKQGMFASSRVNIPSSQAASFNRQLQNQTLTPTPSLPPQYIATKSPYLHCWRQCKWAFWPWGRENSQVISVWGWVLVLSLVIKLSNTWASAILASIWSRCVLLEKSSSSSSSVLCPSCPPSDCPVTSGRSFNLTCKHSEKETIECGCQKTRLSGWAGGPQASASRSNLKQRRRLTGRVFAQHGIAFRNALYVTRSALCISVHIEA